MNAADAHAVEDRVGVLRYQRLDSFGRLTRILSNGF